MLFRGLQEKKKSHFPHHSISLDFLPVVSGSWDVLNLHQGCKCRLNYKHKIRVCSPLISLANCYAPPLAIWCERQLALPKMEFLHCRHEIVRALDSKIACFRYLISKQLSAVLSIKANGTIKLCVYVTKAVYLQRVGAIVKETQGIYIDRKGLGMILFCCRERKKGKERKERKRRKLYLRWLQI